MQKVSILPYSFLTYITIPIVFSFSLSSLCEQFCDTIGFITFTRGDRMLPFRVCDFFDEVSMCTVEHMTITPIDYNYHSCYNHEGINCWLGGEGCGVVFVGEGC